MFNICPSRRELGRSSPGELCSLSRSRNTGTAERAAPDSSSFGKSRRGAKPSAHVSTVVGVYQATSILHTAKCLRTFHRRRSYWTPRPRARHTPSSTSHADSAADSRARPRWPLLSSETTEPAWSTPKAVKESAKSQTSFELLY